jgi:thiol-disulfide isomerase/thioredoxin
LSDLAGRPVVINFWATWCGPCRVEMPMLEKYHNQLGSELVILAVNVREAERSVQAFSDELGLDFPILLDENSMVSDLYRIQGLPTTYFIDSKSRITAVHIGVLSEKDMDGYLEKVGLSR